VHRIKMNTYLGQPGEAVQVTTATHGGGRVRVALDGQDLGATRTFTLPDTPGEQAAVHIDLAGPLGASCGVGISPVDGGTDGDFLLCQAFNPMPAGDYSFQVGSAAGVKAFGALRGVPPARSRGARARSGGTAAAPAKALPNEKRTKKKTKTTKRAKKGRRRP
jgi:hypothetical protein